MYNRRSFSIGLGTGLIAGALLLQLMLVAAPENAPVKSAASTPPADEWNLAKQQALAERHDYALYPKKEKLYTEAQLNEKLNAAKQAEPPPSAQPTTAPVLIYISEGNTSTEVADLLAKAGLIADAQAFDAKVRGLGVDTKLNRGAFALTPGMSDEELLAKLVVHRN